MNHSFLVLCIKSLIENLSFKNIRIIKEVNIVKADKTTN